LSPSAGEYQRVRFPLRHGLRLFDRQPQRVVARELSGGDAFIHIGGQDGGGHDSYSRQQVHSAGACGSEDEPHWPRAYLNR
jgi:hypothetical protein